MRRPLALSLASVCLWAVAAFTARPLHAQESVTFTRDLVPALTKLGCNGGACHGSFQGRGGFRLSLWGFDPEQDFAAIVSEARGRRVFPAAPDWSLLIRKPLLETPHAGGKRLEVGSEAHEILRAWIKTGATGPSSSDPVVERLDVEPSELTLSPGSAAPLKATAHWSDGVVRDVTRWTRWESQIDRVASVSSSGEVTGVGPGGATILAQYGGHSIAVPVVLPFESRPASDDFSEANYIDSHVAAQWKKLGLTPAPRAEDAEFLRRVFLDLIGTLPMPDEARRFLDSNESGKRAALVDALLNRPEYADYWALKWSDRLKVHRRALGEKGLASFSGWLRQSLRENRPFDAVVRELLTAQGNLYASGPVAFYFIDRTPQDLCETTAQAFLGVRMQCARCHHHPFEVWSQDDYYGLAAFFARVERKDTKEGGRYGGAQSVRLAASGVVSDPKTGQAVLPRVLGGEPIEVNASNDERVRLAQWLTAADNPLFARNLVNRCWGDVMGRGLVEPVDDLRASNPPSHPALLDAMTREFVSNGFDFKRLLHTICLSQTYQRASELAPRRDIDGTFYTHRIPRRLSAETLLDAVSQVAGVSESFENLPPGTRAIHLPDPATPSTFLDVFGRPLRLSPCECERPSKVDLRQTLRLANSEWLHAKLVSPQGRVAALLAANASDDAIVEELWLAALSRRPSEDERAAARRCVAEAPSRKEGCEDLLWTLFNLPEFMFNH